MLNGAGIAAGEIGILRIGWIKVRVGLWLGMIYLNENYRGVIPQFHIDDRVAQKDRALAVEGGFIGFDADLDLLYVPMEKEAEAEYRRVR
jgi:hypothetical protein